MEELGLMLSKYNALQWSLRYIAFLILAQKLGGNYNAKMRNLRLSSIFPILYISPVSKVLIFLLIWAYYLVFALPYTSTVVSSAARYQTGVEVYGYPRTIQCHLYQWDSTLNNSSVSHTAEKTPENCWR